MKAVLVGILGMLGAAGAGLAGLVAAAKKRPLNDAERTAATDVFGTSLDTTRVRIAESRIIAFGGNAKALPRTIFFPPGEPGQNLGWLVHELTHSWQYQHGVGVLTTLWHAIRRDYDYGREQGLISGRAAGRSFRDFNTEEQGEILRDYFNAKRAGETTSVYEPFVAEVRGG